MSAAPIDSRDARWFFLLWTAWGALIALLIAFLDRNLIAALAWLLGGIAIGSSPSWLLNFGGALINAYERFLKDEARENRKWQLLHKICETAEFKRREAAGHTLDQLLQYVTSESPSSDEYNRLTDEESFGAMLGMPVAVSLILGPLLGGILGALYQLDPNASLTAWQAAAVGLIFGPIVVSFLAALVFALTPLPAGSPRLTIRQRLLLSISPLFLVPILWHLTARRLVRRRPSNPSARAS